MKKFNCRVKIPVSFTDSNIKYFTAVESITEPGMWIMWNGKHKNSVYASFKSIEDILKFVTLMDFARYDIECGPFCPVEPEVN